MIDEKQTIYGFRLAKYHETHKVNLCFLEVISVKNVNVINILDDVYSILNKDTYYFCILIDISKNTWVDISKEEFLSILDQTNNNYEIGFI